MNIPQILAVQETTVAKVGQGRDITAGTRSTGKSFDDARAELNERDAPDLSAGGSGTKPAPDMAPVKAPAENANADGPGTGAPLLAKSRANGADVPASDSGANTPDIGALVAKLGQVTGIRNWSPAASEPLKALIDKALPVAGPTEKLPGLPEQLPVPTIDAAQISKTAPLAPQFRDPAPMVRAVDDAVPVAAVAKTLASPVTSVAIAADLTAETPLVGGPDKGADPDSRAQTAAQPVPQTAATAVDLRADPAKSTVQQAPATTAEFITNARPAPAVQTPEGAAQLPPAAPALPVADPTVADTARPQEDLPPQRGTFPISQGKPPVSYPAQATVHLVQTAAQPQTAPPPTDPVPPLANIPAQTTQTATTAIPASVAAAPLVSETAQRPAPVAAPRRAAIEPSGRQAADLPETPLPRFAAPAPVTAPNQMATAQMSAPSPQMATGFEQLFDLGAAALSDAADAELTELRQALRATETAVATQNQTAPNRIATQALTVSQQMAATLQRAAGGAFEIRLDPPELGRVSMHITQTELGATAVIATERSEVLDLLRRHESILAREMDAAGFSDLAFSFTQDGHNDGDPEQDNGGSRFTSGGDTSAPRTEPNLLAASRDVIELDRLDIRL